METVYTYDDNGSLKTRTTGEKSVTYHWENDGENRLKGVDIVEGGQTTEIDYEYNEQGIRTGKSVNGVETNYLIDELQPYAQVLEEYDASGDLQAAYTYGEDLISRVEGGETSFYHVDGLGSTRLLTDVLGGVRESYNYDAYGNLMAGDASENTYLFAGEQRDIETGLDYLRARYYDPTLGRFISRDAYQGSLNDPMSQHKYQYAHANPVVNTDPSGYKTLTELAAVAAITATLGGLGLTTVGAIGTGLNGGSTSDVLSTYDQYFAGMMDAMTFGYSTKARELAYKDKTLKHSGIYFNLGRLGGVLAGAWIGSFAATFKAFSSYPWWAKAALGYDLVGTGVGVHEILKDGMTWVDLLYFIPILFGIGSNLGLNFKLSSKGLRFNLKGFKGKNIEINLGPPKRTSTVARIEGGQSRERILIDEIGNVEITRPSGRKRRGVTLFISLDGTERQISLAVRDNRRGSVIKVFEIEGTFADQIRRTAVDEGPGRPPNLPFRVDRSFRDAFGIPPSMFDDLEAAIIPGSGRIIDPTDFIQ